MITLEINSLKELYGLLHSDMDRFFDLLRKNFHSLEATDAELLVANISEHLDIPIRRLSKTENSVLSSPIASTEGILFFDAYMRVTALIRRGLIQKPDLDMRWYHFMIAYLPIMGPLIWE